MARKWIYRYDVINAILSNNDLNIYKLYLRAKDIHFLIEKNSVDDIIILHKRLRNIIKGQNVYELNKELLIETEEKVLFDVYSESKEKVLDLIKNGYNIEAFSRIIEMKPIIDNFFDKVLVMAEDEKVKQNRIALIQGLENILSEIADFSLLVESK